MTALVKRIGLEVVGWALLVGGVAALFAPGPGVILVFAGLTVLSQQYEWAERPLAPVRYRALKGAADGVATVPRIALSVLGVLFLVACGVLWILKPAAPGWWPVADRWWLVGGVGTGSTLLISAAIALGLIVYSYRRFHGHPEALEALEASEAQRSPG